MRTAPETRLARPWPARGMASAGLLCAVAGCGGGVQEDGNGQADRLVCATTCKPSSSLAINQIRPSFVVVSDGSRVQAQAGFSSGSDLRFNVEIDGGDSLRLVTPQGTQGFHIPATSISTLVVDVLRTLVAGATPYLSEVTPSPAAAAMRFQFTRSTATYVSTVELPAPFQITSPAPDSVLSVTGRTLSVRLSSAAIATSNSATFNCADVNGNTATGTSELGVVPGSVALTPPGVTYALAVGDAIDRLVFTTTQPRGAVARCDVGLKLTVQVQGQADPQFGSSQVFAQQIRTTSVAMR